MTTNQLCQQAYAGGDVEYFNAAGCTMATDSNRLATDAQKKINTKIYLMIGGTLFVTGLFIYLSTRK